MSTGPRIASEEHGPQDAPLVVLVHGAMDRMAGMVRLSRRLADDHRVLRYDRRGYGQSAPHPGPFDLTAQVEDLLGLVAGRPCVVVGHSYGGDVALAAAQRAPELVASVAVYEPPLSWLEWWPGSTAGADALATRGEPADAAERFMRRMVGDRVWERLPEATRAARRAEGVALVGELGDLRRNAPWDPRLIECPVVVGFGEIGRPHHRTGAEWIAAEVAASELVMLPGCTHGAHAAAPEVFDRLLVRPAIALATRQGWGRRS